LPVGTLIDAFQRRIDLPYHFLIATIEMACQTRDAVFLGILLNLTPTLFEKSSYPRWLPATSSSKDKRLRRSWLAISSINLLFVAICFVA
jgi:hypothetical protein